MRLMTQIRAWARLWGSYALLFPSSDCEIIIFVLCYVKYLRTSRQLTPETHQQVLARSCAGETVTHRHMQTQAPLYTGMYIETHIDKQTEDRQAAKEAYKRINGQTDRRAARQAGRHIEGYTDI